MEAGFIPAEIVVKHFVTQKYTLEFGPSITGLGKGIRNTIITIVVIKCAFDFVQAVLLRRRVTPQA